jgi:hydrogenase assembly chaperone HypC/HupF
MCQTVPRLVLRVDGMRAEVDYDGRPTWVEASGIDDLKPGEYVNVYAGAALERLPEELALELLSFGQELERLLAEAVTTQGLFGSPGADS